MRVHKRTRMMEELNWMEEIAALTKDVREATASQNEIRPCLAQEGRSRGYRLHRTKHALVIKEQIL
jgi:hypothetical protein